MIDNYAELPGTSRVWVIEDRLEIVGVLVTQAESDHRGVQDGYRRVFCAKRVGPGSTSSA